jgi:putative glutamine amidotransferase
MHHQAVNVLGRGLKAVAWATSDGTIEGVESDAHPWLVMVQFHPEELVGFHQPSQRLFGAFVDACRARIPLQTASLR